MAANQYQHIHVLNIYIYKINSVNLCCMDATIHERDMPK